MKRKNLYAVAIAPVGIGSIGPAEATGDGLCGVGHVGADDEGAEVPVVVADVSQGFGSSDRQNASASHQNKFS